MNNEEHSHSHKDEEITKGYPLPASKEKINRSKIAKIILLVLSCLTLGIGIYFTLLMYIPLGGFHNTLAMGIAQFCGFLMIIYLLATVLLLKLLPRTTTQKIKSREDHALMSAGKKQRNATRKLIIVIGLSLVIVNSVPLLLTPVAIQNAENEFTEAYGENWRGQIPDYINSFFLDSQFNLYNYFVGFPHADCNIDRNILYHEIDEDTYFLFDVYYPKATNRELPGHNSTIIKIHGGGWTAGDKSEMNTLFVNKYLAAQGYIVFDIQYGLLDIEEGGMNLPTPEHVKGNFTLMDMVSHISLFIDRLEDTFAPIYDAKTDSVFIMGGSAGGHLTGVVGLGYNDPYFEPVFGTIPKITIKGIVPLYPANDAEHVVSGGREALITGTPETNPLAYEKFTPSNLADANDPDALFFQGLQDGMVPPKNSEDIEAALEAVGVNAILLNFPLAAHANDYIANNNFAQVWLYYLERFLYLQQL